MALALPEPRWPERLSPLKAVDDLLRCGICFEYFNIAMIIPQCSHNYCSLCIRKFLSYKTQCPTCRVAVTEPELKNNRLLDDLVKSFNSARQQLFQLVLDSPPVSPPTTHGKLSIGTSHAVGFMVSSSLKQDKQLIDSFWRKESTQTAKSVVDEAEYKDSKIKQEKDSSFISTGENHRISATEATKTPECSRNPEKPSTSSMKVVTKVDCPVCGVAIPEQFINKHLDSCLTRDEKKDSLRSSGHKRKPLSKVVYNLLSDRDLKKKLKEHGLSIQGTRRQLVKRHQEFVHVYNAQCDSLNPKSVAEIIKELENNEKIRAQLEFSKTSENSMTFTKDQTEKEIDEIHSCYRNKHKNEFQLLVDQVSNRWKKACKREIETTQDTENITADEEPAGTGEENFKKECTALICAVDQLPKTETSHCERIEFHNLAEDQRSLSPAFSQSSGSTSSSSSDILRDPQEVGMCSESSDNSSFPDVKVNKGKSRRPQTPESSQVLPRSKRRKN
ncbi:PREDICTED: E3 ubiquitin-protein ligase RAD18 isoform X1 [Gavialis gangeticus]|uniref:E3 ubiquitin-protein ligase RAD18 isoform X1 n=1 Tax=Gavialis gangeticus TaxID=94835 RepID=UPI00092E5EDD|nr:PREDICTED: E3 ubiquitin-protein ligase RAD18 isoform X1 [Gavialis gangeticus]